MKRLFISQPMRGKTNDEIREERNKIIGEIAERCGGVEAIDSFFTEDAPDGVNAGLWYLAKSMELLATVDCAYFAYGWEEYRGCKIEHECAVQYGIEIVGE